MALMQYFFILSLYRRYLLSSAFKLFFEIVKKMPCLLPNDCLNEVFEILEDDKPTLHSCLLVSRLWCKISVRILWRDIQYFRHFNTYRLSKVDSAIYNTLISCLPIESKELLNKNEILISTPTSKTVTI